MAQHTFVILSHVNHTTGCSFNIWEYHTDHGFSRTYVYQIRNSNGYGVFHDEVTVSRDERDVELGKLFVQFSSDFTKEF
jgi:hypothetical protein